MRARCAKCFANFQHSCPHFLPTPTAVLPAAVPEEAANVLHSLTPSNCSPPNRSPLRSGGATRPRRRRRRTTTTMTRRSTSHPGRSGRSAERASSHSSRGLGEVLLLLPLLSARGEALQQEAGVPSRHAGAWCCPTMRTSRLHHAISA